MHNINAYDVHQHNITFFIDYFSIPEALQSLSPYISQQLADCVSHPALRDTISLLPGLGETYGKDIPVIPPVHSANDDYPFTHDVPATHLHVRSLISYPYQANMHVGTCTIQRIGFVRLREIVTMTTAPL